MRIDACFDSHVHWAATGEFAERLDLKSLNSAEDILELAPSPAHVRGGWVLGFGWDDTAWVSPPSAAVLERWRPGQPVALSRVDGHALWLNQTALRACGFTPGMAEIPGGRIWRDERGELTGVLIDAAAERARAQIPASTPLELRRHLLKATQIFNAAGFTHIRDMTCDEAQFREAMHLDQSGLLTLAVEEFFWARTPADLNAVIDLAVRARKESSANLRVKGIKVFIDGALGSDGAWLSACAGHSHSNAWPAEALTAALKQAWAADLEVAVHAIGDAAADHLADLATGLKAQNQAGILHLEHGEVMRPETIVKLKALDARVHMQPAHWLSDRRFLEQKLGALATHAFPWRKLQEFDVEFDFGSDAPMDPPSVRRVFEAISQSAESGVPRLLGGPARYLAHSDPGWAPNSFTLFEDYQPKQVVFRGEHIS